MAVEKKAAAEVEIKKAEAAARKLHPLLTQGNDVAPVTRGELKVILEDVLAMIESGTPIALAKDERAIGDLLQVIGHLTQRIQVLEGVPAPAPAAPAPAGTPQLDFTGADELKALEVPALRDFAKKHGIDVSALPDEKGLLADYIAANLNLNPPSAPAQSELDKLRGMTLRELRDLAEQRGVDVRSVKQTVEDLAQFLSQHAS